MNFYLGHSPIRIKAFTMVELMGAVTIALVLIIMLYNIFDKVQRVFVIGQNRAIAMDESRSAMDMMVEDFQQLNVIGDLNGSEPNLNWLPERGVTWDQNKGAFEYTLPVYTNLIAQPFKITRVSINGARLGANATLSAQPAEFIDHNGNEAPIASFPAGSSLELYHHNCRFFTYDGGAWRLVHYRFGTSERYFMPISDPLGIQADLMDTPVGALWLYRSPPSGRSGLNGHIPEHVGFQNLERPPVWNPLTNWPKGSLVFFYEDKNYYRALSSVSSGSLVFPPNQDALNWAKLNSGGIDAPMGFSRLIDGVIHFRVRAVAANNFNRGMEEYIYPKNPFRGSQLPSYVMLELAVLDRKLREEVGKGMEQELEGVQLSVAEDSFISASYSLADQKVQRERRLASERCRLRLKRINENLDRVYFFRQLVKVRNQ